MVGRKMFGQIDQRLRVAYPLKADTVFGGCSCLLVGDFGQLPPVLDLPLYASVSRSALSDLGRTAYQMFTAAVVLIQVMGQDEAQARFRNLLVRLRNGTVTIEDWMLLVSRSLSQISDSGAFQDALHLFPMVEAVVQYNLMK